MVGYRRVWLCLVAGLMAAGLVAGVILLPLATIMAVTVTAAIVSVLMTGAVLALREVTSGVARRCAYNALLAVTGSVAVFGLIRVFGPVAALLVVVVVLSSPPVLMCALRFRHAPWSAELSPTHRMYRTRSQRTDSGLTIEELCTAWTKSCADLRRATPARALRYVQARAFYLDELERHDPDGLRAWLFTSSSAAGSPRRFITGRDPSG